jgi:hypothetical protein
MYKLNKQMAQLVIQFSDALQGKYELDIPFGLGNTLRLARGQAVFVRHDGFLFTVSAFPEGMPQSPVKQLTYIVCDRRGFDNEGDKDLYIYPVSFKDPMASGETTALTLENNYPRNASEFLQKSIAALGDDWLKELKRRGLFRK